ncbi:MAG: hypothetical protein Q9219_003211 [cf. Caloplaca sp. 3 TL-2023]
MVAHAESQSGTRPHGPMRTSTLRQVTTTEDDLDTEAIPNPSHQQHASLPPPLSSCQPKSFRKTIKLAVHDPSSTGSSALLNPLVFPEDSIQKGSLVTISPKSEADANENGDSHRDKISKEADDSSAGELGNGRRKHLFTTCPMSPDSNGKYPGIQVSIGAPEAARYGLRPNSWALVSTIDNEDHHASHVEIGFRDEYLSRSDMWRLVVSELSGKVIHKGQRLAFIGAIKALIKAIYVRGQRVQSAFFSPSTKPVFRSESARYVLFIQMSKEMWDFDADGTGQIMFDKAVHGFLPDLFKRWQQINARHLVTIVMFTRLEFAQEPLTCPVGWGTLSTEQSSSNDAPSRDFFRVVVSDMPSGEWSDILLQLKKEFRIFLRDVSIRNPTPEECAASENALQSSSGEVPSHVITGQPVPASRGNILEAVNLASSQFSCDYIDRDLVRTGISVIVITPGTGLFEVDYDLLATTTDNLIENGVGIDLVCLSRLPLHSVPLFKYRQPLDPNLPQSTSSSYRIQEASAKLSQAYLHNHVRQPNLQEGSTYDISKSSSGSSHGTPITDWRYSIPHWVDVSFWSTPWEANQGLPAKSNKHQKTRHPEGRRTLKPFIPRVRMYELQMMGLTENPVNQIRLPYLTRPAVDETHISSDAISLHHGSSLDTPIPAHGYFMSRQSTGTKSTLLSSSVTSTNKWSKLRTDPRYRWMDDYDQALFQHPRKGPRAAKGLQHSSVNATPPDKKRQRSHLGLEPGVRLATSNSPSTSVHSSGARGKPHRLERFDSSSTITAKSADHPANPPTSSKITRLKPPRISRQISLGFRGFNVSMSKATASTEVSTAHANLASVTTPRQHAQDKSQDTTDNTSQLLPLMKKHQGKDQSNGLLEADKSTHESDLHDPASSRPIPIRNQTEIRISSLDDNSRSLNSKHSIKLALHPEEHQLTDGSLRQLSPPFPREIQLSGHEQLPQISPTSAMAPWLTVVNPSNPKRIESNTASRLGRWQHIFPKKLRASKFKWKSLCSPAAVPLTTEEFPFAEELETDYESAKYKVDLPADEELLERPRSHDWLLREMMAFRFSQGFQVVVGSRLADALYLPNFERFNIYDDSELAKTDTTIVMSRGGVIHKISASGSGQVEVECLNRRTAAAQHPNMDSTDADIYKPMIRTMLAEDYYMQKITITPGASKFDWNMIDARIAGHSKQGFARLNENLRSWRARLVLVPVNPSSSIRRPFQPLNEDNEEELRLEGIRKLTQIWQRFRYVPPSERRFQAPLRKRKDTNPLDIMYQTRNPSAIVAAEKDNMGEDVSTGKPVQLLPDSELFQRSNLNLVALAQTMQGEKGVRMRDRRWHWRLHYNCFIGFELTSWLLQNFRDVDTREEAVELGNELMKNGLFQHVEQRHNFRDGNYFYQVASEHRSARPDSRSTWFGSRKADKIPSTPMSEGPGQESPKVPASRSSMASDDQEHSSSAPPANRQRLGVALSKSLLYDVDHRKKSYRPELITLHYDRLHNPDNCYHIRIDWMNVTSKLIEDAIASWAISVDRFGLKLVEVPLAEASAITSMHPFRAPSSVKLAKSPPSEQPQTYFDATSFTPQAKTEKHFYQKALLKKFDFVLDFEAASDFPPDVDVTYSWGKPDYKYPQFIHRSGTLLAQITDEGDFLLLANRLYNNRNAAPQDSTRSEDAEDQNNNSPSAPAPPPPNLYSATRTTRHRGSPHISPYSSPLFRATTTTTTTADTIMSPRPLTTTKSSAFATPQEIKKQFESFCADAGALEAFYNDVLSKASTPAGGGDGGGGMSTPLMESSIPTLGLPPSVVERGKSPAPAPAPEGGGGGRAKVRVVGGETPG